MSYQEKQAYKIEVNENMTIGVRCSNIVLKDDIEIATSYERLVIEPGQDISNQVPEVQAVANAVWTPEVIAEYQASQQTE